MCLLCLSLPFFYPILVFFYYKFYLPVLAIAFQLWRTPYLRENSLQDGIAEENSKPVDQRKCPLCGRSIILGRR